MIDLLRVRLANVAKAARRELTVIAEDSRLFLQRRKAKAVLRQGRINGLDMLVRADENVGRNIYFYGSYEQEDSDFVIRNIQKSDVCIDVGANVGFYALALAKQAVDGTVHAFEPVPLNRDLLSVNAVTNGISNLIINQLAVGDRNGNAELFIARDGAFSSLVDTGREPITGKIRTRMITLDQYCSEQRLEKVDFLKVDVEGAEEMVIRGATGLLSDRKRQPRLIMLELYEPMLRKFGSSINRVLTMMQECGYTPFVMQDKKLLSFGSDHHNCFENVFFAPEAAG